MVTHDRCECGETSMALVKLRLWAVSAIVVSAWEVRLYCSQLHHRVATIGPLHQQTVLSTKCFRGHHTPLLVSTGQCPEGHSHGSASGPLPNHCWSAIQCNRTLEAFVFMQMHRLHSVQCTHYCYSLTILLIRTLLRSLLPVKTDFAVATVAKTGHGIICNTKLLSSQLQTVTYNPNLQTKWTITALYTIQLLLW